MGVSNVAAGKKQEKKKALPITKKFPELKLMINGEHRNNSNSLSSDDENLNVSQSPQTSNNQLSVSFRPSKSTSRPNLASSRI